MSSSYASDTTHHHVYISYERVPLDLGSNLDTLLTINTIDFCKLGELSLSGRG